MITGKIIALIRGNFLPRSRHLLGEKVWVSTMHKTKCAVAKSPGVQSYFCVAETIVSKSVSFWGACLLKNSSSQLWTAPKFHVFYLDYKALMKAHLSMNGCQIIILRKRYTPGTSYLGMLLISLALLLHLYYWSNCLFSYRSAIAFS